MTATQHGIEKIYVYQDVAGTPIYEVLRLAPKDFRQRQCDGHGSHTWHMDGVQRVPFRLPQLLERKAKGHTVFVVEGEKDVESLEALGFCATTNAGGAAWKYTPEFIEHFRGAKRIVVVPDCDDPGRKAAIERAAGLAAVCDDVRIVDLAPERNDGFDVTDWIADGGTVEQLKELVESTSRFEVAKPNAADASPSTDFTDVGDEPPVWGAIYPWPKLQPAALHGLAGDVVRAIEPETEADPAAMLFTLLAQVGNVLGADARACVGDDNHPGRIYVLIVGDSSAGGKGMSQSAIRPVIRAAFADWYDSRVFNGFGSGEAIIAEYIDPDADRRGLILEPEFARFLTTANRDGSILSPIVREAWDGGTLSVRRAKERIVARGTHISIIAQITAGELRMKLAENDAINGFANRFLPVLTRRSKKLPSGGHLDPATIGSLAKRLSSVIQPVQRIYRRSAAAETLWTELYMAELDRDGTVGALTARVHPQRLRLSVIYAALDGATEIRPEHIRAADACWRYVVASVEHIFGDARGDRTQDRLLKELRNVWPNGLTGAEQDAIFKGNLRPWQLAEARAELERRELARIATETAPSQRGRPTTRTYAVPPQRESSPLNPLNPLPQEKSQTKEATPKNTTNERKRTEETDYIVYERASSPSITLRDTDKTDLTEEPGEAQLDGIPELSARGMACTVCGTVGRCFVSATARICEACAAKSDAA